MRVVVFFVFLFSHLLCRGNDIHVGTQHHPNNPISHCSHHRLAKSEPTNFATANLGITEIEEADLDEEHLNGDNVQQGLTNCDYLLCDKWYLSFFPALVLADYHKYFKSFSAFCADTSPIYIRQRVLRI